MTSFRGCTSHFRFDHFYIVDFHSALTSQVSIRKSEGRVKIYNVKMVKTEMACAPPKTCQNQKSFWIPSNQPPNTCTAGCANLFLQKHVFVKHPSSVHENTVVYFDFSHCNTIIQSWQGGWSSHQVGYPPIVDQICCTGHALG